MRRTVEARLCRSQWYGRDRNRSWHIYGRPSSQAYICVDCRAFERLLRPRRVTE
jgi:hypothetical protein